MHWVMAGALVGVPLLELVFMDLSGVSLPLLIVLSLLTAAVGWWFARREGLSLWTELESVVAKGRVPTEEMVDAVLVLVGGWALIIPGFVTDLLGIVLLVPPVRGMLIVPVQETIRDYWL